MKITTTGANQNSSPLFEFNGVSEAFRWIFVSFAFALCGGVGYWTGYTSLTLNCFIVGFGALGVYQLIAWLVRLRHHISRSEQILRSCMALNARAILSREEADRPIALTVLQAICLKAIRGRGTDHEVVLSCLRRSLMSELAPIARAAKALPAMGLVGTCVGMMGTLNAIGVGAADVTDMDAVSKAVGGSLPSMAVAISTTLAAALIGSITLLGLVEVARTKLLFFMDELAAQLDMFPIHLDDEESDHV